MSKTPKRPDFYSGIPWVDVSPEQVRAHPKGQLNAVLWLIVAYFIGIAILKFTLSLEFGPGVAILNSVWPLLAGAGLALRVPWSIVMACVSAGLTIWALFRSLDGGADVVILIETLINVGILFYLIDGDRPNLIYRHRYRKYSVARDEG